MEGISPNIGYWCNWGNRQTDYVLKVEGLWSRSLYTRSGVKNVRPHISRSVKIHQETWELSSKIKWHVLWPTVYFSQTLRTVHCGGVFLSVSRIGGLYSIFNVISRIEAARYCSFVTVSDINECTSNETNECNTTSTDCVNEPGSYSCTCFPGFYGPAGSRSCNGNYRSRCVFLFRTYMPILL